MSSVYPPIRFLHNSSFDFPFTSYGNKYAWRQQNVDHVYNLLDKLVAHINMCTAHRGAEKQTEGEESERERKRRWVIEECKRARQIDARTLHNYKKANFPSFKT